MRAQNAAMSARSSIVSSSVNKYPWSSRANFVKPPLVKQLNTKPVSSLKILSPKALTWGVKRMGSLPTKRINCGMSFTNVSRSCGWFIYRASKATTAETTSSSFMVAHHGGFCYTSPCRFHNKNAFRLVVYANSCAVGINQIPLSQARLLPNATEYVPGSDDQYIIELDVFHQIHCLNTIRKTLYPERYFHTFDDYFLEDGSPPGRGKRNYTSTSAKHFGKSIHNYVFRSKGMQEV